MKKKVLSLLAFLPAFTTVMAQQTAEVPDVCAFVNPIIGTNGMGHTFPGACAPFGLVQLSPDTDTIPHNIDGTYQKNAYEYCAGYQYHDPTIVGFSHTHLSGTGHSDLGDILIMPATGQLKLNPGRAGTPDEGYRSRFSHDTEVARPGYYEVELVGGGDVAVEDAIFLARNCAKVYLVHRRDELRAAKSLQEALQALPNVEILWDTVATEIKGEDQVEALALKNVKTEETQVLPVDGVFIAVGIVPVSRLLLGMDVCDEKGYLIAGEDGMTKKPGIFAAGDIRTKKLRQIVTAVADGANATSGCRHTDKRWFLRPK